jgi:putative endonuclease
MAARATGRRTRRRKHQKAYARGRRAEALSALLLRLKGYRIVARGFRLPVGEVDILARRGAVLAAVEVKARREARAALESIKPRQRRRIARAAEAYLAHHPEAGDLTVRFDVMVVLPWRLPKHIADAWRL